jgi:glycerol uptake facilitator protein
MTTFTAEVLGTLVLVLLGDGVVANVVLTRTKGHGGGWIVIATGWGLAAALGVYLANHSSGGHLNPAVSVALAVLEEISWDQVPVYAAAQLLGAFLGAVLVWLAYRGHFEATGEPSRKLGVFATAPEIRSAPWNLVTEVIGTALLVVAANAALSPENFRPGSDLATGFGPLVVGLIVFAIGLSLGGPTGYAINPARDLGPRLAHAVLPIGGKGGSDWSYAWVPVVGPLAGGVLGAFVLKLVLGR